MKRSGVLLLLVAALLAACGEGTSESALAAEAAYQKAESAYKEYDAVAALVAAEEAPRELLHQERREYQTSLRMCHEWTHKPQNFAPDELRKHTDQLAEWVGEQSAKPPDLLVRSETLMGDYRKARATFLTELGVLAEKVQQLADQRSSP